MELSDTTALPLLELHPAGEPGVGSPQRRLEEEEEEVAGLEGRKAGREGLRGAASREKEGLRGEHWKKEDGD